jgi:carbon-monoxide dehydrogenase medium subunit
MYPNKFEYVRASSIEEAVKLLNNNRNAKLIAGGHSLLPAMKLRLSDPAMLIDISRIDALKAIKANGSLEVGALATHSEIAGSSDVQAYCNVLAKAAGQIGDQQVRNFGTIGGNIAHADPASDHPTVLVAAGATIHMHGSGGARSQSAGDFFVGLFETGLQGGEIVTKIEIPNLSRKKTAYAKMSHPASRYALVGVCVVLTMDGNTCSDASVAVGGATAKAMASPAAADALMGVLPGDLIVGDAIYPAEYRKAMAGVFLKKAVQAAKG